jgi:hypothetical protein
MPKVGVFDFLTDPSEGVYGAAPKINLLNRPAAYKGFGVDNFSKRVDYKNNYLNSGTNKNILSPSATAGGMKGNLTPGGATGVTAPKTASKFPTAAVASGVMSGIQSTMAAYSDPNASATAKDAAALSGGANAAADTLLSIPTPWTMAAGAAIKGIDMLGKPLLNSKMDKSLNDFGKNKNEEVLNSTAFSGVGESGKAVDKDISDYKGFGTFGKMAYGGGAGMALGIATGGVSTLLGIGGGKGKLAAMKRAAEKNLRMQTSASGILNKSKEAKENMLTSSQDISQRNLQQKYSPDMYKNIQFGRNGGRLKFQHGGKMNVIVNGKLHKELHGLDNELDLSGGDITRKGIPVISHEDGGEILQHSEVEKNELILTRDLTKKLEAFKERGDDESMIEAGKLLAYEIVKNTKDSKDKIIKNA